MRENRERDWRNEDKEEARGGAFFGVFYSSQTNFKFFFCLSMFKNSKL